MAITPYFAIDDDITGLLMPLFRRHYHYCHCRFHYSITFSFDIDYFDADARDTPLILAVSPLLFSYIRC
jgi:hypothetical protein